MRNKSNDTPRDPGMTDDIGRRRALIKLGLAAGTAYIAPTILRIDRADAVVISCPKGQVYSPSRHKCQPSDRRLKRDIEPVGRLANGIGIYRYRYVWDDRPHVGVIAQEVAPLMPEAIARGPGGYLQVDYAGLGQPLSAWRELAARHQAASPAF